MSARERTLAIILFAIILVFGGVAAGYALVWTPIQAKDRSADVLDTEIEKKQAEFDKVKVELKKLDDLKKRSLPSDVSIARREYAEVMNRLLLYSKVPPATIRLRELAPDATGTPALAGKKLTYTKLAWEITFERADMWNIHDFLLAYYRLPLLHQITLLDIKTDAQPATTTRGKVVNDRRDLVVKIITEAIILDGAEPRGSLFSVPNAFAAIGGLRGLAALAHTLVRTPEASRDLIHNSSPVLAARPRDYTLVVQNDVFHGPLPLAPSMNIERIADVSAEMDKPIAPVKVRVVGDVGPTGKFTLEAKAAGKILSAGSGKVDQLTRTIAIEPMEGEVGSGEITVTARTAEGKEAMTKFKVKITEPEMAKEPARILPDISEAIRLVTAVTRSDGTAIAYIRDDFNPFTYEIEVSASGRIKVLKFFYPTPVKKKDPDYLPDEPSHLIFSDENVSATKRSFQVIAIDSGGLYLVDLKPKAAPAKAPPAKGAAPPKPAPAKQGSTDALSLVVGAAVLSGQKPAEGAGEPKMYRWAPGQSLKTVKEVPADEAKKILERVKLSGPVAAN